MDAGVAFKDDMVILAAEFDDHGPVQISHFPCSVSPIPIRTPAFSLSEHTQIVHIIAYLRHITEFKKLHQPPETRA